MYQKFQDWCNTKHGKTVTTYAAFGAMTVGLFSVGTILVSPTLGIGLVLAGWGTSKLHRLALAAN